MSITPPKQSDPAGASQECSPWLVALPQNLSKGCGTTPCSPKIPIENPVKEKAKLKGTLLHQLCHQAEGWCVLITQGPDFNTNSRHPALNRALRHDTGRGTAAGVSYLFICPFSSVSLNTFSVSKTSKIWDHCLNQVNNYHHSHPSAQSRLQRCWTHSASGPGEIRAAPEQPNKGSWRLPRKEEETNCSGWLLYSLFY